MMAHQRHRTPASLFLSSLTIQDKLEKLEVVVLLGPAIEFCCNNWAARKLFR